MDMQSSMIDCKPPLKLTQMFRAAYINSLAAFMKDGFLLHLMIKIADDWHVIGTNKMKVSI